MRANGVVSIGGERACGRITTEVTARCLANLPGTWLRQTLLFQVPESSEFNALNSLGYGRGPGGFPNGPGAPLARSTRPRRSLKRRYTMRGTMATLSAQQR